MSNKQDLARRNEVRRVFQTIYPNATAAEVLTFYAWLEENSADLLPSSSQGDQYQQLKSELQGLFGDRPVFKKASKKKDKKPRSTEHEALDLSAV